MSLPTVSEAYALRLRRSRRTRFAHLGKALLSLSLVALVLALVPGHVFAQQIALDTSSIATQFWAIFKTVRQIVVGLALLYTFIEGLKAIKGDGDAWKKVISGFVVVVVMLYPNFFLQLFGVSGNVTNVVDGPSL